MSHFRILAAILGLACLSIIAGAILENLPLTIVGALLAFGILVVARVTQEVRAYREGRGEALVGAAPTLHEVEDLRERGEALSAHVIQYVATEAGVRVEDWITALAAVVGDAAIHTSDTMATLIEHGTPPGSGIMGPEINVILTGDQIGSIRADSVVGIMQADLVPVILPDGTFNDVDAVYEHVATNVGKAPFGGVIVGVPADHQPLVTPLRASFELRDAVDLLTEGVDAGRRYQVCTLALSHALTVTYAQKLLDMDIAKTIALHVMFGVAKLMPMTTAAFEDAASVPETPHG